MIPVVDLKAQYLSIKDEVNEAIANVFDRCQFILGEQVEAFEAEFADYCQAQYAIGVNSGTSALHLALLAAGLGPGDEAITVSYTFTATAMTIRYTGAKPVFVDINPRSYTIDPEKIEAAITPRTKAILPVHIYGQCADMDPILEIARAHGLVVIEDAAQAHGAEYKGRRAGSLGDIACFSFYPSKNLGSYGESGGITTNNADYAKTIKGLREYEQSRKYHHETLGYNYRLEEIQGAVLRVKLRHLDDWNEARRRHAAEYRSRLGDVGVGLVEEMDYGKSSHHLFPVFSARRDALQEHMKANGITTSIHYPVPVHMQNAYSDLGHKAGDFPVTEQASSNTLSLPMYPELSQQDLASVAHAVRRFYEKAVDAQS